MKKKVLLIFVSCLVTMFISFNLSIKDKKITLNTSLKNEALACNIIPEGVEDYCWNLEFYPEYYTCTYPGVWSCYI